MWWKSFFTIKLIVDSMEILLMVHVTQGPYHGCLHMLHACLTSWNFYMDPIRVKVHRETSLWQAQRNLVGMNECGWMDDLWWFHMIPRCFLLGLEGQHGHLVIAQKPNTFHLVMGLCSSWWCILFLGCRWSEWDSSPFHHKDLDYLCSFKPCSNLVTTGFFSMDVMFGINDKKYHLFTLMTFYFHLTWVLVVWIITS
jgi:hypothetical protein